MKKFIISVLVITASLSLYNCGPAAEDRVKMHENAKRVSDSIGKTIDAALAQGAIPGTATTTPADTAKTK